MSTRRRCLAPAVPVAAAITCLALGWWQWRRFTATGGTAQNLGYALQWPLFAGFCIYAYRRFIRLEAEQRDGLEHAESRGPRQTEIPPDLLPAHPTIIPRGDDDPVLAEYNHYLAELNARETRTGTPDDDPSRHHRHRSAPPHRACVEKI